MNAKNIRETTIISPGARQFHRGGADCAWLAAAGIDRVGFGEIDEGYHVVRRTPSFSHLACCHEGEAEVCVGGEWMAFTPGVVVFQPEGFPHGLRSVKGTGFVFFWVTLRGDSPFLGSGVFSAPGSICRDSLLAFSAVRELCRQGMGRTRSSERLDRACVDALASWMEELACEGRRAGRLERMWLEVARRPREPWDTDRLAKIAGMSPTHLRRVCLAEAGTSPMRHVTRLRIEQAKTLLRVTDMKLDEIAGRIGYATMFAFSTAFTREVGLPPREWRRHP